MRSSLAGFLFAISTVVHVTTLLLASLLKALMPVRSARRRLNFVLTSIAENWVEFNTWMIRTLTHTRFEVDAPASLRADGHYLVLSNHQSWVDIPAMHVALNRKVPFLRFFLKSQLFWVPFLGLAWWALDFPFMKRYSREVIAKRPHLAGRDIEATRRSCERFRDIPISIMNFVEGTRFTPAKHDRQQSPFTHLLKPKAGGVGFVLDAMGGCLHSVLDVTVIYPHGRPTFADLFNNRIPLVKIQVRERPIPVEMVGGDYQNDPQVRERVQNWVNEIWRDKDVTIQRALSQSHAPREEVTDAA